MASKNKLSIMYMPLNILGGGGKSFGMPYECFSPADVFRIKIK